MTQKLLICSCLGSQDIARDKLEAASGLSCSKLYDNLCLHQLDVVAKALEGGDVTIACAQEASRFQALAEELDLPEPGCVDLRDRAGWHDGQGDATPKMVALLAEAALPKSSPKALDVHSEGTCLILGSGEVALGAARQLANVLAVTLLIEEADDLAQAQGYDIVRGALRQASGALGNFEVEIESLRQMQPGGRGAMGFEAPRDGAMSACDIILDLRGATPLFPAHHKREGYLRADPGRPEAVAQAVFEASQLVGTFEKPLYVRLEPSLCAHSRAEQTGCSKCLDLCPTGAITTAGDHVSIDPMICAGCGSCSAVCPSGAISYDAPPVDDLFRRISTLARSYREAGGADARLLVHDSEFGAEMIALSARHGRGLPVDVIPLEVSALAGFGHAEALAALSSGFATVDILVSPRTEAEPLTGETLLANAIAGQERVSIIDVSDPDALSENLYNAERSAPQCDAVMAMGSRRQVTRLAARALRPDAEIVDLPENAPYGAVLVDQNACTLCLSCVSLCPSGALGDNPDLPQLRFQEDACLQCGICETICPEQAITLAPRLNLTDEAFRQTVLHEEEPFACVECGALFGVKSTVEKITEKLAGKHAMFANSDAARMIQMCDNCRVNAQYHMQGNPLAGPERPRVRTTDDYFSKRKDH